MCWLAIAACNAAGGGAGSNAGRGGDGNDAGTSPRGAGVAGDAGGSLASAGASAVGGGGANGAGASAGGNASAGAAGTAAGASSGNAGGSGGPSGRLCGVSGLLFCEDFEKLATGPVANAGPWSTSFIGPDAPTIIVDATTPAHSGTHSVMVHAPLGNFQSFLNYHDAAVLPRAQGDFYLRSYVRLGREMAEHHNTYLILEQVATAGSDAGPDATVRLGEQANMLSLTVGGDAHGSLSNSKVSQDGLLGAHFVANSWACLEGHFTTTQPQIDFWLDGVEISDFHHTDWPSDNYDTLHFGFEKYAGPELDIWFDDIAISASRIGCQ